MQAKLLLAPLVCLTAACGQQAPPAPYAGKSVVLVSLDTLRADRLGCYGYDLDTSPFLDKLAAEGVRFDDVTAPASKTAPSHMSMFSGLHPAVHGVRNYYGGEGTAAAGNLPLLPELFREAGYTTAAFTGGGMMTGELGFARGFQTYDDRGGGAPRVFGRAADWLRARAEEGVSDPFFLFVHTYEIHDPYTPPAEWHEGFVQPYEGGVDSTRIEVPESYAEVWKHDPSFYEDIQQRFWGSFDGGPEDVRHVSELYDAGIAYTDDQLLQLLDLFGSLPLGGDPVLVLTSDHGEEFSEHGNMSHQSLFQEVVRVPLLVRLPGGAEAGRVVNSPVQGVDLTPSLVALCGLELPIQVPWQGRSWAGALFGEPLEERPIWTELATPSNDVQALRLGSYKLIEELTESGVRSQLFDLGMDPEEGIEVGENIVDYAARTAELAQEQRAENAALAPRYGPRPVELGEEAQALMDALGYGGGSED